MEDRISPYEYFNLFGRNNPESWKALVGQRVFHINYKHGIIDEVEENCIWIRFDETEGGKHRNYFPKKGLDNPLFTELTVPAKYAGQVQAHRDRIAIEKRNQERIEKEKEREQRETEFSSLKKMFKLESLNYPVDSNLFEILWKLKGSHLFTMNEVRWLLKEKLHIILALYFERQYYRNGNLINAIRAHRWWNKIGDKVRVEDWVRELLEATMKFENRIFKDIRKGINITKGNYALYLASDSWKKARVLVLTKADFRCQVCNSTERLNVHHRTYDLGNENLNDLTVLCRKCHELFHKNKEVGYHDLHSE